MVGEQKTISAHRSSVGAWYAIRVSYGGGEGAWNFPQPQFSLPRNLEIEYG